MIRRIFGVAHVEDLESIHNLDIRATCERRAVKLARDLLVNTMKFNTIQDVISIARNTQ